jgi:opacity protein-like surface antigen
MTRFFTLLLICISIIGISQSTSTPKYWSGGGLEYKVSKWVKLDVGYQYRAELNKDYDAYAFSDIGSSFRITKKLSIKPSFRLSHFSNINDDKNRASLDVSYKFGKKKSSWSLGVRVRGQYQFHVNKVERDIVLRQKVYVGYKLNN